MAKQYPAESSGGDRADWTKDDYIVVIKREKCKKVPNPYYMDEAALREKYGEPEPNERFWLVKKDGEIKKRYPDFPEDAEQWSLVCEVVEGEKRGDWLFIFASPRFYIKKDNSWGGKIAAIYHAAMPDYDLNDGIEDDLSDLDDKPFRVSVEPKPTNAQYANVKDFLPVKKGYKMPAPQAEVVADDGFDGEDIPF